MDVICLWIGRVVVVTPGLLMLSYVLCMVFDRIFSRFVHLNNAANVMDALWSTTTEAVESQVKVEESAKP